MITANQARLNVQLSGVTHGHRMSLISDQIEKASLLGKNEIWVEDTLYNMKEMFVDSNIYRASFTPVQLKVREDLMKNGFKCEMTEREINVGGGLGSMDDEVTTRKCSSIRISW